MGSSGVSLPSSRCIQCNLWHAAWYSARSSHQVNTAFTEENRVPANSTNRGSFAADKPPYRTNRPKIT